MMGISSPLEHPGQDHPVMAVLGIGAVEQHGPHLPVGTDMMIADELSRRVAQALGAWQLQTIPFSMSECHGNLAGTVWLKPATLAAVLEDIVASVNARGARDLLVLNGHGGNFILDPAIRSLRSKFPGMIIALAPETWPEEDEGGRIFESTGTDLHAGEMETSLLLFLHPELVQEERVDFIPVVGREFLDYTTIDKICPQGVWGSASLGTAEKGRRAMEAEVKAIVSFVRNEFPQWK